MEDSNNTGKLIGALLVGAVIGGALGILFAPEKGSETRKKFSEKGDDLTNAMKEKINDFLEELQKEVEAVKDNVNNVTENGTAKDAKSKAK